MRLLVKLGCLECYLSKLIMCYVMRGVVRLRARYSKGRLVFYNKEAIFGTTSIIGRAAAVFSFVALLAFYAGPFYWPDSNSAWAGFLRFAVLISVILYLLQGIGFRRVGGAWVATIVFFSYMLINSFFLEEGMQSARRLVFIFCFVFMVANFWREPNLPQLLLGAVALLGALFAAFSLFNLYQMGELDVSYRKGAVFSSGISGVADFGNTIVAAMHYAVCYCAALWMLLSSKNRYFSIVWTVVVGVISIYIAMTFARTGWVACLIATLVFLALTMRYEGWRRVLPFVVVIAGVFIWFASRYLGYEVHVRGVTYRDEIWATVLQRVELNLLWGYGAGAKFDPIFIRGGAESVSTAHSTYLEVLYQFGSVGLLLMLTVLFMALRELVNSTVSQKRMRPDSFGLALLGSASVVMFVELYGFVNAPNLLWGWFWLPLGIALSGVREGHAENRA